MGTRPGAGASSSATTTARRPGPARTRSSGTWPTCTRRSSTRRTSTSTPASGAGRWRPPRGRAPGGTTRRSTTPTRPAARTPAGRRSGPAAGYTTHTRWSATTTSAARSAPSPTRRASPRRRSRPRRSWGARPWTAPASARSRCPTRPGNGRPWARRWRSPSWTSTASTRTRGSSARCRRGRCCPRTRTSASCPWAWIGYSARLLRGTAVSPHCRQALRQGPSRTASWRTALPRARSPRTWRRPASSGW
mmetsp:Transcript_81986/g.232419  ORF Transcript_81986/g.232419 Transcript_81986/m.232419 type:complete len:249 (-) Transcript_81986:639-1385(-)